MSARDGDLRLLGGDGRIAGFARPLARPGERENATSWRSPRPLTEIERDRRVGPHRADPAASRTPTCSKAAIRFVELFAELGVRVIQLTYNNQNELGGSCYEDEDSGLSRFGREVVREMNRCRHPGRPLACRRPHHARRHRLVREAGRGDARQCRQRCFRTSATRPTTCSKALAETGGVIGCAAYRNITGDEYCSSVEAWCEMVARTVDIMGIDHVGIGTDRSHNFTQPDYDWMRMGRWTRGVDYGAGIGRAAGQGAAAGLVPEVHHLGLDPGRPDGASASTPRRSRRSPAATGCGSMARCSAPPSRSRRRGSNSCRPILCSPRRHARPPRERHRRAHRARCPCPSGAGPDRPACRYRRRQLERR